MGEGTVATGVRGRRSKISCDQRVQINARDGVHEGYVDPDGLRNQIFHFSQHCQLILGLDIFWVSSV